VARHVAKADGRRYALFQHLAGSARLDVGNSLAQQKEMKAMKTITRSGILQALMLALVVGLSLGAVRPAEAQAGPSTQTGDPIAVVDAFHAAGDDIDAALALLTEDVVIQLMPPPPNTTGMWKGKAEARAFFEWRNAQNIRRERVGNAAAVGNTVNGLVNVTSDGFRTLGVGAVGHTFSATVEGGKLKSYLGQITPDEAKRLAAVIAARQPAGQTAGMPRTGEPLLLPLLIAACLLILTAGAALRRLSA
jgi:hypothetical protein